MCIEKSKISLGVYGDNLDPDKITKLLGCKPTIGRRKGDIIPGVRERSKTRLATTGCWILVSSLPSPADLEAKITEILDNVANDSGIWASISNQYSTRIFCGIFLTHINEGFTLKPKLLKCLSDLHIEIGFDIYAPPDISE